MSRTPITEAGLRKYDHLPPLEAALLAWSEPGSEERRHRLMQNKVRNQMPLLARALDRATYETTNNDAR